MTQYVKTSEKNTYKSTRHRLTGIGRPKCFIHGRQLSCICFSCIRCVRKVLSTKKKTSVHQANRLGRYIPDTRSACCRDVKQPRNTIYKANRYEGERVSVSPITSLCYGLTRRYTAITTSLPFFLPLPVNGREPSTCSVPFFVPHSFSSSRCGLWTSTRCLHCNKSTYFSTSPALSTFCTHEYMSACMWPGRETSRHADK